MSTIAIVFGAICVALMAFSFTMRLSSMIVDKNDPGMLLEVIIFTISSAGLFLCLTI